MRRVVWSATTARDLAMIRSHIAKFSPAAADRMISALRAAAESLAEHPDRGRAIPGGKRELVAISPYLIRYRVLPDVIRIIRIRHAARRSR